MAMIHLVRHWRRAMVSCLRWSCLRLK